MKKAIKNIARMMHHSDPQACFNIDFWDGDVIRFGNLPRVTLRLKTKRCAKRIIEKGFLGFGESYMMGDLEVDNDLEEFLRLGLAIDYDDHHLFQILFSNGLNNALPITRAHVYHDSSA